MVLVKESAETGAEMVRSKVCQAAERRGNNQPAALSQEPGKLTDHLHWIGDVLQHFDAQYRIEGVVRLRDRGNIANDVQLTIIPRCHLETRIQGRSFILSEILRDVVQVGAEFPVRLLARSG